MADEVPPNRSGQGWRLSPQLLWSALTEIRHTQFVQGDGYGRRHRFRDRDQRNITPFSAGA